MILSKNFVYFKAHVLLLCQLENKIQSMLDQRYRIFFPRKSLHLTHSLDFWELVFFSHVSENKKQVFFFPTREKLKKKQFPKNRVSEWGANFSGGKKYGTFATLDKKKYPWKKISKNQREKKTMHANCDWDTKLNLFIFEMYFGNSQLPAREI